MRVRRICLSLTALCLLIVVMMNLSSCSLLFLTGSLLQSAETRLEFVTGENTIPESEKPEPMPEIESNADMGAISREINSMRVDEFSETEEITDYVKITFKDYGDVIIRLRPDIAPLTVENFRKLVSESFYDGLTIHRVVRNFVIQGGDPEGDGTGGSGTTIKGEFAENGVQNDLSHITGVISMARKARPLDSATSQFFICNANASASLDGKYAGFGYVVAGLEVILAISDAELNGESPVEKIVMEKVCFVTK